MTQTLPTLHLHDGFRWTLETWGPALRCGALSAVADHFFTTSALRLRGEPKEREEWAAVAAAAGVPPERLWRLKQVHGRDVVIVPRNGHGQAPDHEPAPEADAHGDRRPVADIIATDNPDVAISVQVADCVPLLMADPKSGAVAAAHAGWRGTAANVAATAVELLGREYGARPEDLVVAHGPSIGACCYNVGAELVDAFRDSGFAGQIAEWFETDANGVLRMDLWRANRDQLLAAGVQPERLHQANLCTSSHPELFHSYRRDGKGTGRIVAVIRPRR